MYRFYCFLALFCLFITSINAQIDNRPFFRFQEINEQNEHNLSLFVSHLSYNKDNEYFNAIADGYTYFGNQLSTSLVYFPTKNIRLESGIYIRKDFGNNKYSEIAPIFSVKIKEGDLSFIFGTIEGSLNHQLIEPLYDFEKIIINKQENGIQFLLNKKAIELDAWLIWENMLYRGDSTQEKLSGGLSSSIHLIKSPKLNLSIPLQFTAQHIGGQIDASPLPLTTKFNGTAGLKMNLILGTNFFKELSFEPYYLVYKDFSFEYQDVFHSGKAIYLNLALKTKLNTIMLSYWNGDQYLSTHGGLLYNSRSTTFKSPNYIEAKRKLLMIRFLTDIHLTDYFSITSRFEPFYDFTRKQVEFSLGLYINYHDNFKLMTIKGINKEFTTNNRN